MTAYYRSTGASAAQMIYDNLKKEIARGDYEPGARLPTEAELSRAYGVQRDTARSALKKLAEDGLIVKQSGKDSYTTGQGGVLPIDRTHLNDPIVAHLLAGGGSLNKGELRDTRRD